MHYVNTGVSRSKIFWGGGSPPSGTLRFKKIDGSFWNGETFRFADYTCMRRFCLYARHLNTFIVCVSYYSSKAFLFPPFHCWLNIFLPFHGTFSRHGKAKASLALLIWLNENVHNFLSFSIFLAVHDVDFLATMLSKVPFKRLPYHKHG